MQIFNRTIGRAGHAALLLAGLALSACATTPRTVDSDFPIKTSKEPYLIEVPLGDRLSAKEAKRVESFARRYRSIGEGELTVAYPQDGASRLYVAEIVERAHAQGVKPREITVGAYSAEKDGERGVVLSFYADDATSTKCPEWGRWAPSYSNADVKRLGCAHRTNLAAMIERPKDLKEPRALSPSDVERRGKVLDTYRAGETTASESDGEKTDTTN